MSLVTVVGGAGVFGARIAGALASGKTCDVRIVGRSEVRGGPVARKLGAHFHAADLRDSGALRAAINGSTIVIHAAGPFQSQDYHVAEACLETGAHYLDLADGREFVSGITLLNERARARNLLVTSGVSSAPAITSAMAAEIAGEFSAIDEILIALSPGNQNPRGDSTIAAVLSYLGRPIRVWENRSWSDRPGWGDAQVLSFPMKVGRRKVYSCDVPDLELFPACYPVSTVRFKAGLELGILNAALSVCAMFARRFKMNFVPQASLFRKVSLLLYPLGSKNGSLALWMRGRNQSGADIEHRIAIVTDNDGPATPSSAAIVLTRRILAKGPPVVGAVPCFGLIELADIMAYLEPLGIWCVRGDASGWFAG